MRAFTSLSKWCPTIMLVCIVVSGGLRELKLPHCCLLSPGITGEVEASGLPRLRLSAAAAATVAASAAGCCVADAAGIRRTAGSGVSTKPACAAQMAAATSSSLLYPRHPSGMALRRVALFGVRACGVNCALPASAKPWHHRASPTFTFPYPTHCKLGVGNMAAERV